MRELPDLSAFTAPDWPRWKSIRSSDDTVLIKAFVAADTTWFRGHFDDHPVLPGVAQVNWAATLAMHLFPQYDCFERLHNIKFVNLLLPDSPITLELTDRPDRSAVAFVFRGDDARYSSGSVIFRQP